MPPQDQVLAEQPKATGRFPAKAVIIAACAIVLFLAFRGGGDPFVGTWKLDIKGLGPEIDRQLQAKGLPAMGVTPGKMPGFLTSSIGISNSALELRSDSTYSMTFSMPIGEKTQTGTWTVQNDSLFLKPSQPGERPIDGRRDGRRLLITMSVPPPLSVLEVPYER